MCPSGLCSVQAPEAQNKLRFFAQALCGGLCILLLAACSVPGSVRPTIKIGLSAPFEGLYRDLGYEALYAVRLAVRERNANGGVGQRYLVELVALNDLNEAEEAAEQARKMAIDPGILGVLGGLSADTAQVALEYEQFGLGFLAPNADLIQSGSPGTADPSFAAKYTVLSGGAPPGPAAIWAYSSANRLLNAMDAAARSSKALTRSDVQRTIGAMDG